MHPAGCLGAAMGLLSQQPHFIQGLASSYSVENNTGVPKCHAVRNETKNEPDAHLAKRNETKPKRNTKQLQCPLRETETKQKQVRCPPCAHLAKRNETKLKWAKLIQKRRFVLSVFFSVFSVTIPASFPTTQRSRSSTSGLLIKTRRAAH